MRSLRTHGGLPAKSGTSILEAALGTPLIMDDKTINLWRQIEGARRVGKRGKLERSTAPSPKETGRRSA